jgi:hypothetical protein
MKEFKNLIENSKSDFIVLIQKQIEISKPESFKFIEDIIQLLFDCIKQAENINEANIVFDNLANIQFVLARAVFKNNFEATPFLRSFIHDFDRIDDNEVRQYYYDKLALSALNK